MQVFLASFNWRFFTKARVDFLWYQGLNILVHLNNAVVSILPLSYCTHNIFFQAFGNRSKYSNYNWYLWYLHVRQRFFFFLLSRKILVFNIILLICEDFTPVIVFYWSLSDRKSLQVSRTLIRILVDFNNAVVWMVSTCSLISKSSSPCTSSFVTVPTALLTTGLTVTFMFHSFFSSLPRSRYLSLFLLSSSFILWSAETSRSTIRQVLFLSWLSLGLVVRPRLGDLFVSQIPKEFCASHFLGRIPANAYNICFYIIIITIILFASFSLEC